MPRLFDRPFCLKLKLQAEMIGSTTPYPPDFRGERRGRSARKRPLRIYAAHGLMCRELHDPLIRHRDVSIKTKNTFQTIFFFQRLPTRLSTAFQEMR
jgi:hypothetical protein